MSSEPYSAETLHAYVDGELQGKERARVRAWLRCHPDAQSTVDDFRRLNGMLRELYAPLLQEPVPRELLSPAAQRPGSRNWRNGIAAIAASVMLLSIGTLMGWQLARMQTAAPQGGGEDIEAVAQEAAMAYTIYAPEVLHPVEVSGDRRKRLTTWLGKRLGTHLIAPSLSKHGYHLLGGRLLSSEDGPGALLMYENAQGGRLVLYTCHNDRESLKSTLRFSRERNIAVYYWTHGGLWHALAGETDHAVLKELARSAHRQMSS